MFPKGGLAMNRDRLLISSAMLTSLNEANKTDNLNLLEPFVQVCIASTTPVNTTINKAIILEKLKQDFALSDMPSAVLDKILIRLSKRSASQRIVEYKNKEFRFVQNPMLKLLVGWKKMQMSKSNIFLKNCPHGLPNISLVFILQKMI